MTDAIPRTQIDFAVRADSLCLHTITDLLGVEPTRGFERGDVYLGKQKTPKGIESVNRTRPFGVWHFCTAGQVAVNLLDEHASLILERLEPALDELQRICRNPDFFVKVTIWYVGPAGFSMQADLLRRLAAMCEEVSVTCWEVEDA